MGKQAEIEDCWQRYEAACSPEAQMELEDTLAVMGLTSACSAELLPTPRRIDSTTHRSVKPPKFIKTPKEDEPTDTDEIDLRPKTIDPDELDEWGEYAVERHNRDERERIIREGRTLPYLRGWETRPTTQETRRADATLASRKPKTNRAKRREQFSGKGMFRARPDTSGSGFVFPFSGRP